MGCGGGGTRRCSGISLWPVRRTAADDAVYDDEEDFKDARDTLSKFVIGKPAEDSKRT